MAGCGSHAVAIRRTLGRAVNDSNVLTIKKNIARSVNPYAMAIGTVNPYAVAIGSTGNTLAGLRSLHIGHKRPMTGAGNPMQWPQGHPGQAKGSSTVAIEGRPCQAQESSAVATAESLAGLGIRCSIPCSGYTENPWERACE